MPMPSEKGAAAIASDGERTGRDDGEEDEDEDRDGRSQGPLPCLPVFGPWLESGRFHAWPAAFHESRIQSIPNYCSLSIQLLSTSYPSSQHPALMSLTQAHGLK